MAATVDFEIKITLNPEHGWRVNVLGRDGAVRKQLAQAAASPDCILRIANGIDHLIPELTANENSYTALTLVTMANDQAIRQLEIAKERVERDLADKNRMLEALRASMRTPVRTV